MVIRLRDGVSDVDISPSSTVAVVDAVVDAVVVDETADVPTKNENKLNYIKYVKPSFRLFGYNIF